MRTFYKRVMLLSINHKCKSRIIIQDVNNVCGDSVWKAAKLGGKLHSKKDQTGVMLSTRRHSLILKALDMHRGEIYEYPYLLQVSCFYNVFGLHCY